jgi:hypothetical protein
MPVDGGARMSLVTTCPRDEPYRNAWYKTTRFLDGDPLQTHLCAYVKVGYLEVYKTDVGHDVFWVGAPWELVDATKSWKTVFDAQRRLSDIQKGLRRTPARYFPDYDRKVGPNLERFFLCTIFGGGKVTYRGAGHRPGGYLMWQDGAEIKKQRKPRLAPEVQQAITARRLKKVVKRVRLYTKQRVKLPPDLRDAYR